MLPHVWITFLLNKLVSLLYNTGLIRFFSSNETHVYKNQKNVLNQTMGRFKNILLSPGVFISFTDKCPKPSNSFKNLLTYLKYSMSVLYVQHLYGMYNKLLLYQFSSILLSRTDNFHPIWHKHSKIKDFLLSSQMKDRLFYCSSIKKEHTCKYI